jgi:hypothetical protein
VPRAARFAHVEHAEHGHEGATIFHHRGRGTLGDPQRIQWAQSRDQIHTAFPGLDHLDRVVWLEGVVKDEALYTRKPGVIPVVGISFQHDAVGTFLREGEAFHQLVRPCAPRARAVEDSPVLLAPAEFAIELSVAHMQDAELD